MSESTIGNNEATRPAMMGVASGPAGARLPWVTPKLERTELKAALAGAGSPNYIDGITYLS